MVSRGKGKSAVAAAAYRAGENITNEYDGQIHDYTRKSGIVYTALELPENAPLEYTHRATLWNAVEKIEKAKNAQLAREVRLALPAEFNLWQNVSLVHEYVKQNFTDKGMCADIAIHDKGNGNPHAHIMLTMRPIELDGSWGAKSKMEYILDNNGERIKLPSGRYKTKKINVTDWDERSKAEEWRESWAKIMNMYLEYYNYENRVDHKSYERQGMEQIPTIHLGVVAHDLEKRGIRTERGDTNRRIKAANARIKWLDKQIYEIKNPPIPQSIIDLEKSIKAQNSPGYAQWAKIFNLQQAAQTLIYIQENGFTNIESLQIAHQNAKVNQAHIQKQINSNRAEIKSLTILKTQVENYRNTLEVYKKYTAPGQFKHFKEDFYSRHKGEIEKHKKARVCIFEELKLEKFPSLKKLSGDISALYEKEKSLRQELKVAQSNAKALTNAEHNIRMLLGYKELETKGYTPTVPIKDLRYTEPYIYSFAEAQKRGETEAYFQSCNMDYQCAEDISKTISRFSNPIVAAEEILRQHNKKRAECVVAAIVNNAPADKYPDHTEWASKKTQAEPSARNVEVLQRSITNVSNAFIQAFREAADSMKRAIFTVVDDDGKQVLKPGWAFSSEFAPPKAAEKSWDEGLSIKDRLATAERLAAEHNRNRQPSTTRKPRSSNDHDL